MQPSDAGQLNVDGQVPEANDAVVVDDVEVDVEEAATEVDIIAVVDTDEVLDGALAGVEVEVGDALVRMAAHSELELSAASIELLR